MEKRIVLKVTDYLEKDLQWEKKECEKLGVYFKFYQKKAASLNDMMETFGDADIILTNMMSFTADVLMGLKNLKLLLRHGIGYDNIDINAATQHGIVVANQATAFCRDVAEHTIMLMFDTYRMKKRQEKMMQVWKKNRGRNFSNTLQVRRMEGKTLGIVGCGNIGSQVLKMVNGFAMKILVCDPYLSKKRLDELGTSHTPLDLLLKEADIITIHVPLTEETRGMFNYGQFKRMKKSAIIINTARGPVIKSNDLARALIEGELAGAGLDVFEAEPPTSAADIMLTMQENVITTPHFAWYSEEGNWDIRRSIMDDVRSFLKGNPPKSVVNPDVLNSSQLKFPFKRAGLI